MADHDEALRAELARLDAEHSAGRLTTYEFNRARRAAREQARAASAKRAETDASPASAETAFSEPLRPAEGAETQPAPVPAAEAPRGWGDGGGTKHWEKRGRVDDPSVRIVHQPTAPGIGTGKAFLFVFGLRTVRDIDQKMLARELEQIDDDIAVLRANGYTVVVDSQGSKQDFLDAIYGQAEGAPGLVPAGIYWSAHGHDDGSIECCDGARVAPSDVETARVSPGLRLMVMGACYTGAYARTWRTALGGHPLVVGWGRPVTIDRAVEFLQSNSNTENDLDDLIERYLLADNPIAPLPEQGVQPAAHLLGSKVDLVERLPRIAELLGARYREQERWLELRVPLPTGREHTVRLFTLIAQREFLEGRLLVATESDVGELSALVEIPALLQGIAAPGFVRVTLVKGRADLPDIVAQALLPHAHASDIDIAAVAYQTAEVADDLERRIFGGDRG